jgi:tetratricopeptide (TPR) repeat protein
LTKAIELKPDLAEVFYCRGFAQCKLEKYEEAIEDFTKTLKLKPDHAKAKEMIDLIIEELKSLDSIL